MPSNILLDTLKTNTNTNINKTILTKTITNLAYQCFHGYKTHNEYLWDEIEQNKQTASENTTVVCLKTLSEFVINKVQQQLIKNQIQVLAQ